MAAAVSGRVRTRRPGKPGPRGGGVYVSEQQRTRLLNATFEVVAEDGYRRMTVRRVCGQAGVSNKTFYDLFADREECFLAAFDQAVAELTAAARPAYEAEREWASQIRAGLGALLACLDSEAELRALVFVEALGAGPQVLKRRAQVVEELGRIIDEGRAGVKTGRELPPLTAEGLVGAAFGVIYGRLIEQPAGALLGLSGPLMAAIVLPYRGHTAAERELARPTRPTVLGSPKPRGGTSIRLAVSRLGNVDFRLTVRTQMVLDAIAEHPGASNRQLSDIAEIVDQGQISKLLTRLEGLGLIENTGRPTHSAPNAWQLTPRGEEIVRVGRSQSERTDSRADSPEVAR
jgi:AcrR family transcriptional regulator